MRDRIQESLSYWRNSLKDSQQNLEYLKGKLANSKMESAKQAWQGLIDLEEEHIAKCQKEIRRLVEGRYGESD